MGCGSSSTEEDNIIRVNYPHSRENQAQNRREIPYKFNIEPFLFSKKDPEFNFREVDEDIYKGEGLKKMKGYVSSIPEEELIKKRNAFWETRIEGNKETWEFLRNICESTDVNGEELEAILQAMGIVAYNNCINITYDDHGGIFEIPNYCIHMPTKYDLPEDHKKKPKQKNIRFVVKDLENQLEVENNNYLTVAELKDYLAANMKGVRGKKNNELRLFFGGKELKDDKELWFYNVSNASIVLLMVRK